MTKIPSDTLKITKIPIKSPKYLLNLIIDQNINKTSKMTNILPKCMKMTIIPLKPKKRPIYSKNDPYTQKTS
jgi:hypothetical protein